ncbi:hypothetical protein KQX54_010985 [Cotesia glomerata]|uniref:Uncharacterized protein n=1 Tax=Cotesia glomerata TaxID=32391 RepID=A0AAV7J6I0_COTGL|nr:hypothetical protein KQX54_010985 [Cotesia glomerata]
MQNERIVFGTHVVKPEPGECKGDHSCGLTKSTGSRNGVSSHSCLVTSVVPGIIQEAPWKKMKVAETSHGKVSRDVMVEANYYYLHEYTREEEEEDQEECFRWKKKPEGDDRLILHYRVTIRKAMLFAKG